MDWKKLGKALLFPHIAIVIILVPLATAMLICSMVFLGTEAIISYVSYVLAAYTLTVVCFRIPRMIAFFKSFKRDNKYARRLSEDTHLRVNLSLYGSFLWNFAYAIFQLCLGFYHHSFWFCSLAGYYVSLAAMRFFLARHVRSHRPGEEREKELKKYRVCGVVFLLMNLALALMIFFMVYWNRTFHHHEITTIAMAAYTFTAFSFAIVGLVRYRKYDSPVYSATKAISLAAACVSMLTLESTMLTTFSEGEINVRLMLGLTGAAISAFIVMMAVYMIVKATKQLKEMRENKDER